MRISRTLFTLAAAVGLAVTTLTASPGEAAAQSNEISILVAPVSGLDGVDRRFGERIAEEIRERLQNFPGYQAVDEDDVEDAIDQYDLDERAMQPLEWRQLASVLGAGLVMVGSASPGSGGVVVDVNFMDPTTGDELPIDPFTVQDDDEHEEAAGQLMAQFEGAVEYARSLAFCSEDVSMENVQDAMNNCNAALELNPGSERALYLRGRAQMLGEAWGAAAEDLEQVVQSDPSNTEALQALAYTHAQLGHNDRSLELYQEYLNFQPDDVQVRMRIAYELATAGGHAEATAILQDGVERAPDNVELLNYLGGVALTAGRSGSEVTDPEAIRTAVEALEKVVEIQGDEVEPSTLSNITSAYMLIEEYDDALAFSERAIDIIQNAPAPTDGEDEEEGPPTRSRDELLAQVYQARAQIYRRQEQFGRAAEEFSRALEHDATIRNGYQTLAQYKLMAGDTEGAIEDFRTAVENGAEADEIANALFGQGYANHLQAQQQVMSSPTSIDVNEVRRAIDLFEVAEEFARSPDTSQQVHFFAAFGYYLQGTAVDARNEGEEACAPARQALSAFRAVGPHLAQAGSYQTGTQNQIREAVDVQLYRQEQIVEQNCGG